MRDFQPAGRSAALSSQAMAATSHPLVMLTAMETEIRSEIDGVVVGRTTMPAANAGDALFYIASIAQAGTQVTITDLRARLDDAYLFDEDEII